MIAQGSCDTDIHRVLICDAMAAINICRGLPRSRRASPRQQRARARPNAQG